MKKSVVNNFGTQIPTSQSQRELREEGRKTSIFREYQTPHHAAIVEKMLKKRIEGPRGRVLGGLN